MNLNKGEFWDITANAFRGCRKISTGCNNCWALRMAWRHAHNPKTSQQYTGLVDNSGVTTLGSHMQKYGMFTGRAPAWTGKTSYDVTWAAPLRVMKKRKRVFLNGMGDMFHEANYPSDVQHCLQMIRSCPQHLFIVATKRPATALYHLRISNEFHNNLILLTSTEDQKAWDTRLPYVIDCKENTAAVGAICEPLVGPINPTRINKLDWVLVGGETGPGARYMDGKWNIEIMSAAQNASVPYFFKQWGGFRGKQRSIYQGTWNEGPEIWKYWST